MSDEPTGGNDKTRDVTRREFLQGATAGALSAGLLSGGLAQADPAAAAGPFEGPAAVPISLTIDGKKRELRVEPRVTLLDAMREGLGITGPKRVCDRGACGACTVLLDGKPVYACSVLAIEARGRRVETVASLGTPDRLHPIQAAFVEHDAQQCGFCTPGFVMATKALLDRDPSPDDAAIDRALGGNLCRCGTYAGMRRAVHTAAESIAEEGRRG